MTAPSFKHLVMASLLVLAASAEFFFYRVYVVPRSVVSAELQSLSSGLAAETQAVPVEASPAELSSTSIPELLARVQELALSSGISVASIEPQPTDNAQFRMTMDASYSGVIRFLARFEALRVAVTGFEMTRPQGSNLQRVILDFRHTATPSDIHPRVIAKFESDLRSSPLFDPFDPASGAMAFLPDRDPSDLTWTFHLTSISEIGERRYATIDGRDYVVGDALDGRVISSIGEDSVTLKEPVQNGEHRTFLRFREILSGRT